MISSIEQFFRGDYMPHGHCYLWQPHILWTHVVSDLLIATAYFSIPLAIILFTRKRKDIDYHSVFILFSLFILCCGITHLFGIWTIWHGVYGYHGLAKAATAIVSIATALYLFKLLPDLLKVPTIEQYEGIKSDFGHSKKENIKLTSLLEGHMQTKWMLDALPISFVIADEDGCLRFSNEHFDQEFGEKPNKLIDLVSANNSDNQAILQTNAASFALNQTVNFVGFLNASLQVVEVSLTKRQSEQVIQLFITIKDLKDMIALKDELVESNARFERAISATNDGIWDWNIKTGKQVWSPKLYELIGLSSDETPSYEKWFEHIHPTFREVVQNAVDLHLKDGEKYEVEYLGRNINGDYHWYLTRGDSIRDEHGQPLVMSGSLRDINDEKEAKRLLDKRTQFLNALYMGANHAIWVVKQENDKEFRFTTYNNTALRWTGINEDQILNKTLSQLDFFDDETKKHLQSKYYACLQKQKPIEYIESLTFENEPKWFQTSLYPVKAYCTDEAKYLIGTAVDITREKKTQKQIENNNHFLESLLDSSVCGFYIFNLVTLKNERINKTYTDLLGYTLGDLDNMTDLMSIFHPRDRERVAQHIERVLNSTDAEKHQLEYRFKHKRGYYVWCNSIDSVIERDSNGQPLKMLGTFVDVSEKNNYLNQLKASNEYLEQFAFIASHDLQEPLRKISAFSESIYLRLKNQFESDPDSQYELERLQLAAKRLSKMIEDLLKLSRINFTAVTYERVSLRSMVALVVEHLELAISKARAKINIENDDININVDVGLFQQLLQNLITNAIKFVKQGQAPVVTISSEETENHFIITIFDNGIGIEPTHFNRIFEPFKRLHTREQFEGNGIGLAIVAQIIKVHHATIHCESSAQGSQFIIQLPKET